MVLDEWMPRNEDKAKVIRLLVKAEPMLSGEQRAALRSWIGRNFDE